jgi:hypothetical protein
MTLLVYVQEKGKAYKLNNSNWILGPIPLFSIKRVQKSPQKRFDWGSTLDQWLGSFWWHWWSSLLIKTFKYLIIYQSLVLKKVFWPKKDGA